jgi:hypothetical protein
MERSGGGRENEGILVAMRIKQRHDSSGIAGFVLNKTLKKKIVQRCRPPNSDLIRIFGGLFVLGSKRSLVFADLTAPAVGSWSACGQVVGRLVR